jgi:hypothetical protein
MLKPAWKPAPGFKRVRSQAAICLSLPLERVGVGGCSAPAARRPLLAGEAGGDPALPRDEAEFLELRRAAPGPRFSRSACEAAWPLVELPLVPLVAEAAGGVAWVQRFLAGGGVSSLSRTLVLAPGRSSIALQCGAHTTRGHTNHNRVSRRRLPQLVGEVILLSVVVPVVLPDVHRRVLAGVRLGIWCEASLLIFRR